jgi:hypothetical protein
LTYRAIAALDDASYLAVLKTIYGKLEGYEVTQFYWTIRPMTHPALLEFRKKIRAEKGGAALGVSGSMEAFQ